MQQRVKARVSEIAAGFASAFGAQIDVFLVRRPDGAGQRRPLGRFRQRGGSPGRVSHPPCRSASRWRRFCGLSSAYSRAFVSIGSASEYGLHHPAFNPDGRPDCARGATISPVSRKKRYNTFNE
ncbi:hypothetical protein LNP05_18565 [Klebsiella pneumoniae subsp. pneumoniae]|nr:hypothetical protein [Klebsiella pneumoniae subsp. pneumoniae]